MNWLPLMPSMKLFLKLACYNSNLDTVEHARDAACKVRSSSSDGNARWYRIANRWFLCWWCLIVKITVFSQAWIRTVAKRLPKKKNFVKSEENLKSVQEGLTALSQTFLRLRKSQGRASLNRWARLISGLSTNLQQVEELEISLELEKELNNLRGEIGKLEKKNAKNVLQLFLTEKESWSLRLKKSSPIKMRDSRTLPKLTG